MKKFLTLLILSGTLFSCKKESPKICWHCEFGMVNGIQEPPRTVCNNGATPTGFKDKDGNNLSYICEKQ